MLFTLVEILSLALATLVVGYIFTGIVRKPTIDVLERAAGFNWNDYWFAVSVAAPSIILHELAHKFVAIAFGLAATFEVWPTGLVIGIILKLLNTGFMILAPGYVVISGATPLISSLTAFAGPLTNLALWIGAFLIIKYKPHITRTNAVYLSLTREINKWLFIFNILPVPPLDGFKVIAPLFALF